jgi:D-tyrosyl-tRNA(Tyr) deacylase
MRAVVQRVSRGSVQVNQETVAQIGLGLLVLLGVATGDTEQDAVYLADKIVHLRVFEDKDGKMNRSVRDEGGQMLVVSQFTLLGDCRKGRRPSFAAASEPLKAEALYQKFIDRVRASGLTVETGCFGAMMQVALVNDGPVTLLLES